MKEKKILRDYNNLITYSKDSWALLKDKRSNAIKLLEIFVKEGFNPFVYGSIARGDVHESSDIDITFVQKIPSFQVEYILHKNGYENYFREIIMATPLDSIKLYIHLSELESITVPLTKFEKKAIEFYNFGGKIALNELQSGNRVSGIDKRLVLIKPNQDGHEESSVIGNEALAAKQVGVGINTVNERIRVLLRREKYGKTGVYLKQTLQLNESTEEALKKLAKKKAIVRKKLLKS
ncbi:MAG: nucleotidyltransferase domain-containing protein [Candidatus Lokiarchaeota archaeon]|nr:nucleotidyltransferase domain-containing protein [Candidatus Lokiarchaeota archaeon]